MSTTHATPIRAEELAALCVGGQLEAGIDLVHRLWAMGVADDGLLINGMVMLAVPTMRIGTTAFDRLADALHAAREIRDLPLAA